MDGPASQYEASAPTLNPNWRDALEKVMHTSLMAKENELDQQDAENGRRARDVEESIGLSEDEEEEDEEEEDNEEEEEDVEDGTDDDTLNTPSPKTKPFAHAPPAPAAPRAQPMPRPVAPTAAVFPAPVDARAEAHLRRVEENRNLQREEKFELLGRLQYFTEEKGFKPFRALGPDDSLEDIRYEVFRAQREMSKKRNVKMMQKALVTVGAGIEMMNAWYNPLKLNLDGFSKSLLLSIREYDEIFEELHWKYCDAVAMPPEMKLVMTLGSSIWFFHMSNATGAHVPAMGTPPQAPPRPQPSQQSQPSRPAADPAQRRMNGPRAGSTGTNNAAVPNIPVFPMGAGGGPASGMDMTSLLSGIGMVQTLMNSGAKF